MLVWQEQYSQNSGKEKWLYSGYEITFDSADSWNFNNDFARNFVIFGVDSSSSSLADNSNNNHLVLGKGSFYEINGSFGSPEKMFVINFSKESTKFCLCLPYNIANSYLFVN